MNADTAYTANLIQKGLVLFAMLFEKFASGDDDCRLFAFAKKL